MLGNQTNWQDRDTVAVLSSFAIVRCYSLCILLLNARVINPYFGIESKKVSLHDQINSK